MSCPCGTGRPYEACCGPYLSGEPAPTAEALMRSRYTAYARGQLEYLEQTHDPETAAGIDRAATARWANQCTWLSLQVIDVKQGGPDDAEGEVEFAARWREGRQEFTHHERSRFRRRGGRWFYVDGATPKREPVRRDERPSPNAPCPCGSGMKFKRCHGR